MICLLYETLVGINIDVHMFTLIITRTTPIYLIRDKPYELNAIITNFYYSRDTLQI